MCLFKTKCSTMPWNLHYIHLCGVHIFWFSYGFFNQKNNSHKHTHIYSAFSLCAIFFCIGKCFHFLQRTTEWVMYMCVRYIYVYIYMIYVCLCLYMCYNYTYIMYVCIYVKRKRVIWCGHCHENSQIAVFKITIIMIMPCFYVI